MKSKKVHENDFLDILNTSVSFPLIPVTTPKRW